MDGLWTRPDVGTGSGKVILLGEHAVVYGRPALITSLSKGALARARSANGARTFLTIAPWNLRLDPHTRQDDPERELLRHALLALLRGYDGELAPLTIEARLEIHSAAGLGSSAALSVAILRAVDRAFAVTHTTEEVIELSMCWERIFHGNPSGADSTMAANQGTALFRKGEPLQAVSVKQRPWLTVGHSGEPGRTRQTVGSVARQRERDPQRVDEILDAIEALVKEGTAELALGRLRRLGQLMDLNQTLLSSLLLSTPRLEEMCRVARAAGALGAKLTGGGGGGCMIALSEAEEAAQTVCAALQTMGREAFVVAAGG